MIFSLPFLGAVYVVLYNIHQDIEFTHKQRFGIALHQAMFDLQRAAIEQRALLQLYTPQNATTAVGYSSVLTYHIKTIDSLLEDTSYEHFGDISKKWHALKQLLFQAFTTQSNFATYAEQLAALTRTMKDVGGVSNLILDPQTETYHMADILISIIPATAEYVGYLSVNIPLFLQAGGADENWKHSLLSYHGRGDVFKEQYLYAIQIIEANDPENVSNKVEVEEKSTDALDIFIHATAGALAGASPPDTNLSAQGQAVIAAFSRVYVRLSAHLDWHLSQRETVLKERWLYALAATAGIFFTMFVLFLLAYRNLVRLEEVSAAKQIRAVLNTVADSIVTIDEKGIIQTANPSTENLFGYQLVEMVGQNVHMLMPEPYHSEHDGYITRYLHTGQPRIIGIGREVTAKRKDGSTFPIALAVNTLEIEGRRIFVGIMRDMTQHQEYLRMIETTRNEAERATQLKSEFLANMSHEIRTPLNGVIGMANLLLECDLGTTERNYADTVLQSAEHLLQVVDDILDLSKIEAGRIELERIPFDCHQLVQEVCDMLAAKAREKNVALELDYLPDAPRYMLGDPARIRQIVLNLVSNAIKFTAQGNVRVAVATRSFSVGKTELTIAVEDSGIGIPEDKLEYIFNKFNQADGSTTRKFGGTGLGLAICRELAQMMGGNVSVTSTLGKGSVFTFKVTLEDDPAQGTTVFAFCDIRGPLRFNGAKVLLAEDNPVNQQVAMRMLEKYGCHIISVANGHEAVKHAKTQVFDLVLMDCQMPEMDGYEATREIRNIEKTTQRRRVPVVAFTAHALKGDADKCMAAGMDDYITKPLRKEALERVLKTWLLPQPYATKESPMRAAPPTDTDILHASAFSAFCELMGEEAPEVLTKHCEVSQGYIADIRKALDKNHLVDVQKAAHPLKSSSAQIGAMKVSQLAREIEDTAKHVGADTTALHTLIGQLADAQRDVEAAIKTNISGSL